MFKNLEISCSLLKVFLILNSGILLMPDKAKGVLIVGLLLSSIFHFTVSETKERFDFKLFLVSISFFVVLLISIIYSKDLNYALRKLETSLSLLAYPIIFVLLYNIKENLEKSFIEILKSVFVITLAVFLISTFTFFLLTEPYFTFKSAIVHYVTLIDLRIVGYEIHSIYLAMYVGVGILFLLSSLPNSTVIKKIYVLLLISVFLIFLALLNKKGPILALVGLTFIYLIKIRLKLKPTIYIMSSILIFISVLVLIPKYKGINRFKELVDFDGLRTNANSSTSIRLDIYQCSINQFIKSPIIGYGWGDVKGTLNECYEIENPNLLLKNYNSHNQFLSILLSTGIVGLFVFFFYFYFIFKFSNKSENQLLFFLLLYFGLNMLSENILEREDGVVLFSFFINLFLFNSEKKSEVFDNFKLL